MPLSREVWFSGVAIKSDFYQNDIEAYVSYLVQHKISKRLGYDFQTFAWEPLKTYGHVKSLGPIFMEWLICIRKKSPSYKASKIEKYPSYFGSWPQVKQDYFYQRGK